MPWRKIQLFQRDFPNDVVTIERCWLLKLIQLDIIPLQHECQIPRNNMLLNLEGTHENYVPTTFRI